jgi:ceramide glucosyltransferase
VTLRGRAGRLDTANPHGQPPVSILRPVCGIEHAIDRTLGSGFALDYPDYELIFCVADAGDPIVSLIEEHIAGRPAIPARVVIGDRKISDNPKLNNCVRGWHAAQHPWVVLADSNVLMPVDYVQQMLSRWQPDSGLVCSPPIGSRPHGFWAHVECAFLNTLQARWQYASEALGLGFAQGKSMLWRKAMLDASGGIEALAAEIAEDAAATKLVRGTGLRVHLVDTPFEQPLGTRGLAALWSRQTRWARLRRVTFPAYFVPELLISVLLPAAGTFAGLAGTGIDSRTAALAAALLIAATYAAEMALAWAKGWEVSARLLIGMLARDCLMPAIWVTAWTGARVVWHGQAIEVRARIDESETPSVA